MTRRLRWLPVLLALACADPGDGTGVTALTGAAVVDVATGTTLPDAVVLIRDGRILAVGSRADVRIPGNAQVEELPGRTLIPGLIDAHAHLQPWGLASSVAAGVTAVRDLHDGMPLAAELRRRAATSPSPRLFLAGAMLDAPPTTYPDAFGVTDSASIAVAVDSLARSGAAWIKAYTKTTPELLAQVVAVASARGLPVATHLGLTDARTAARLGVRSIEHLSGIPEALGREAALGAAHRRGFFSGWTAFEYAWGTLDTLALDALARDLAPTGIILVPTLGLHETFSRLDDSSVYQTPDVRGVADSVRTNWNVPGMIRRAGWDANDFPLFREARPLQDRFVRAFVAAGGRVATGTDASNQLLVPGGGVHLEMELLVRAGLTPAEALRAATMHGAALLGADSLGAIVEGKLADLVVLGGNPLGDIRLSRQVQRVMIGGRWVK